MSVNELGRFADEAKLNITNLEAKIYSSRDDETITVWFNDILSMKGSAADKIASSEKRHKQMVQDAHQEQLLVLASDDIVGKQNIKDKMDHLLKQPLKFYKIDVLQTQREIAKLLTSNQIVAINLPVDKSNMYLSVAEDELTQLEQYGQLGESFGPSDASINPEGELESPYTPPSPTSPQLCGTGVPSETSCPPDKHWLPSPKKISGARNSSYSFVYNYTTGSGSDLNNPKLRWSKGTFHSTLRWSQSKDNGRFTNTAAFKRTELKHCNPDIDFGDLDAQCAENNDHIFVPESTYEDEGVIDNPACLTPRTPDTRYNRVNGCWEANYASSSLPYAYLDTTLSDGPDKHSASIGSYRPDYLVEGNSYNNYSVFWAYEHNNMLGREYNHQGQIGTRYGIYSPLAVFSVDSSLLSRDNFYFPIYYPHQ